MFDDLITPRPGPGVCPACFNFTREPVGRCRACRASESHLAVTAPISYAAAWGPLHRGLADYKRAAEPAVPWLVREFESILSRFLTDHEECVAVAAGVERFDRVEVVPSSQPARDANHPLRGIVGHGVPQTAGRYREALRATGADCVPHRFDPRRFTVTEAVEGQHVLLIDDVWTTGASAQSAAACLLEAGARRVAAVVIGRYVNGHWGGINERLAQMEGRFDPAVCALCLTTSAAGEKESLNRTGTRSVGPRLMDS